MNAIAAQIDKRVKLWSNGRITQTLVTDEHIAALPALYSGEGEGYDALAHLKLFGTGGRWTWYATEAAAVVDDKPVSFANVERPEEITDVLFYGYTVSGLGEDCDEWGYFTLASLCEVGFPPFNLPVERDTDFEPTTIRDELRDRWQVTV